MVCIDKNEIDMFNFLGVFIYNFLVFCWGFLYGLLCDVCGVGFGIINYISLLIREDGMI